MRHERGARPTSPGFRLRIPAPLRILALLTAGALIGTATAAPAWAQSAGSPALTMGSPSLQADGSATVPITFTSNGAEVANLVFAVDYDSARLTLDPADANQDAVPDAVTVRLPAGFQPMISLNPNDPTRELQVVIAAMKPPLPAVPDGTLMTLSFQPVSPGADLKTAVRFGASPPPSMGTTSGRAVQAKVVDPLTVEPPQEDWVTLLAGLLVGGTALFGALFAWWWRRQPAA